jgi:hypothetical protein
VRTVILGVVSSLKAKIVRRLRSPAPTLRDHGFTAAGELDRVVVVSPHLDDAVFGCGDLLAARPGSTVITVFAASPPEYPTSVGFWDAQCGFGPADDSMAIRRAEDAAALALLGAIPVWLPYCEDSHVSRPGGPLRPPDGAATALEAAIRAAQPSAVVVPFGLSHPEHRCVHDLVLEVRDRIPEVAWFAFAEIPYQALPGELTAAIARLTSHGVTLDPVMPDVDPEHRTRKVGAVEAYVTQVGPLDRSWALRRRIRVTPEWYWRIGPPVRRRRWARAWARGGAAVVGE